ncbi:MAG: hypothetical protein RLZZ450_5252 [Pseudomonadota bacterium]|jgi:tol-pal system protein YbgF
MNGVWPKGRTAHAGGVALLLMSLPACAHGSTAATAAATKAASAAEVEGLRAQLAARDQTVQQLEGRLAMIESSQRQLRGELEAERSLTPLREAAAREPSGRDTVRIGAQARESTREPRAVAAPPNTTLGAPTISTEVRPVLRLNGDRRESDRRELTSSWVAPTTTERLSVSPVPALSDTSVRASAVPQPRVVPSAREPEPATSRPAVQLPSDDLYVHALDLLRRRELPEALRELDAFVRDAPRDPRFARAQFWRGELLFAERQFARALAAYEQVLLRDGSTDKAAETLLRIARCHQRLGSTERARAALLRLRTQFPESAAARQAEQEPPPTAQEDT